MSAGLSRVWSSRFSPTFISVIMLGLWFHVERLQTEDATKNLFFGISEVQQVGSEGANIFTPFQHLSKTYSRIFLKSERVSASALSFLHLYILNCCVDVYRMLAPSEPTCSCSVMPVCKHPVATLAIACFTWNVRWRVSRQNACILAWPSMRA